ncbi:MAG: hypothetical protein V4504_01685 [Patescibacteria group bacterium]
MQHQVDHTKSKKECSACGTAPTNHHLMYFSNLLDEVIMDIGKPIFTFLFRGRESQWIIDFFEKFGFNLFHFLGFIRYSDDVEKASTGRSKLIWEEALRRGIKMQQAVLFGKYTEYYRAQVHGEKIIFQSLPIPPWLPRTGYDWIDDKLIFAKKLQEAGMKSPMTRRITSLKDAFSAFDILHKPIILKPQSGSRGRHTTTNIHTKEQMEYAYLLAQQISPSMVAQEHLFGSVYRATVVNNVLVGFFRADQPYITGDGIKNIKELILEKNKNRPERISEIVITEEILNFLNRQKYTLESILPKDISTHLLAKTGRLYGGYTKEMLPEVHPKIHSIFKKAGEIVSVPVAGFDLIIQDPTIDPDTQNWGIIECNSLPFIDLHYFAFDGEPVNVATFIWDLWDMKK